MEMKSRNALTYGQRLGIMWPWYAPAAVLWAVMLLGSDELGAVRAVLMLPAAVMPVVATVRVDRAERRARERLTSGRVGGLEPSAN
jgi:hypothetical protein